MTKGVKSWHDAVLDVVRKSKRAAISITLVGVGMFFGKFAAQFEKPLDSYASYLCFGISALGCGGLLWIFVVTFKKAED